MNAFLRARRLVYAKIMDSVLRKTPHSPEKTLVIIDMQSLYMKKGEDKIVPVICSLIQHAKQNEWAIIVLEFEGSGKTHQSILSSLVGYPHWTTVLKQHSDGGPEVIQCVRNHPTWSMDFLVCGIYGPECVANTVCGILDTSDLAEVSVVTDAVKPAYMSCTEELENSDHQEREITVNDVVGARQERGVFV